MKKSILYFAVILAALTQTAFADVKIKTRQTMSGQSYENTTYIKGKRQRAEQNMGGMETVTITQCDLRRDVRLMPVSKAYMIDPFQDVVPQEKPTMTQTKSVTTSGGGTVVSTITIKDTGERKQMFGYTARHLIITTETEPSANACMKEKSKMQTDGWYIDAEWQFNCDRSQDYTNYRNTPQNSGCMDKYTVKQIGTGKRGYPLYEKMTMFDDAGGETYSFVNEVVEISKATLDNALFEIPADYREVKTQNELYASMSSQNNSSMKSSQNNSSSQMNSQVKNAANQSSNTTSEVGAKKQGVIRIGMANVKTGSVGEGMNAQELAAAIKNTLAEYLKSPKIELVNIDAKLPSAIDAEAKEKECDYVIYAQVSHKKGSGGFGVFSKIAPVIGSVIPGGNVAETAASTTVYTAASASANVKAKDEISLDVKLNQPGNSTPTLSKQAKAKAKSDGEDIISPLVEQIAQAIVDTVAK
jgi:hypothetical protein